MKRLAITIALGWLLVMFLPDDSPLATLRASEAGCPGSLSPDAAVLLCDDFEDGTFAEHWVIGSRGGSWPDQQFVLCGNGFGFEDHCSAWSNSLVFDGSWGFWGYSALRTFSPQSEFYVRWYQYVSDPYTWGPLEDKSILLHDAANTITAYVASSRDHLPVEPNSGPGVPFIANYQDVDWPETGWAYSKVNRFQNQGNTIALQPGRWYLFEWYIRLNTPGASDGVTKLWIDDASEPIATQTLRMHYTDMRWLRTSDAGKQLSTLQLTVYHQRCDGVPNTCPPNGPLIRHQSHRWDRIVVSTNPIGPLTPPGVSISSPLHHAIISGTTTVTASPSTTDIAGVQFLLDGAPLGPEDTAPPYSVSWDSTAALDGQHTLTAVARTAAGARTTSGRVSVAVANLHGVSRVDEQSANVTYTSSESWIHGNTDRNWSGGTAALAYASAQRVTVEFGGTGVSWIGYRGPQAGVANVYLDQQLVGTIDAYAPAEALHARLFTASGLVPGPHTLSIEIPTPRTRHRLSSDYFMVVDAFDVIGTLPKSTATRGLTEETSAAITYDGAWLQGNAGRAWSGGTAAVGFAAGQQATLQFSGTGVRWIGFRGPQTGIARVYLDGALVGTVDAYAAAEHLGSDLFTVTGLAEGVHWLTIEVTGTKDPASTDYFVVVDAVEVY